MGTGAWWPGGPCFHPLPAPPPPRSHPSPAELVEVLGELRRLEGRLEPFRQRYQEILGSAASADYNNNVSPGGALGSRGAAAPLFLRAVGCSWRPTASHWGGTARVCVPSAGRWYGPRVCPPPPPREVVWPVCISLEGLWAVCAPSAGKWYSLCQVFAL